MCQPQLGDAAGEGEGGIFVACVHVRVHAPFLKWWSGSALC